MFTYISIQMFLCGASDPSQPSQPSRFPAPRASPTPRILDTVAQNHHPRPARDHESSILSHRTTILALPETTTPRYSCTEPPYWPCPRPRTAQNHSTVIRNHVLIDSMIDFLINSLDQTIRPDPLHCKSTLLQVHFTPSLYSDGSTLVYIYIYIYVKNKP